MVRRGFFISNKTQYKRHTSTFCLRLLIVLV
nr:MAG TPA: hypothetical protein [Caudoviricetes sp.]